jgi:hypothetical protein
MPVSVDQTNGTNLSGTGKIRVAELLENKSLMNAQTQPKTAYVLNR